MGIYPYSPIRWANLGLKFGGASNLVHISRSEPRAHRTARGRAPRRCPASGRGRRPSDSG